MARPTGRKTRIVEALMEAEVLTELAMEAIRAGHREQAIDYVRQAHDLYRAEAGEVDRSKGANT